MADTKIRKKRLLKRAPEAPKRFKSAYICFVMEKIEEFKLAAPNDDTKMTTMMRSLAIVWKSLPESERLKYTAMANIDKSRYFEEMAQYAGPLQVPNKRPAKPKDAPKRSMSAFLSFSQMKRSQLRQQYPDLKNTDISGILSQLWRDSSEEDKRPHIERELREREKYHRDMTAYKQLNSVPVINNYEILRQQCGHPVDQPVSNLNAMETSDNNFFRMQNWGMVDQFANGDDLALASFDFTASHDDEDLETHEEHHDHNGAVNSAASFVEALDMFQHFDESLLRDQCQSLSRLPKDSPASFSTDTVTAAVSEMPAASPATLDYSTLNMDSVANADKLISQSCQMRDEHLRQQEDMESKHESERSDLAGRQQQEKTRLLDDQSRDLTALSLAHLTSFRSPTATAAATPGSGAVSAENSSSAYSSASSSCTFVTAEPVDYCRQLPSSASISSLAMNLNKIQDCQLVHAVPLHI